MKEVHMANNDFEQNKGKIKRLYPDGTELYFSLGGAGSVTAMNPANGYYVIHNSNANYIVLVDLVYLCAEHGWTLKVRTQPNLNSNNIAEVVYLVVDFNP
jgi:hypothetical protein